MARDKSTLTKIDKSDLVNYPNARIKDDAGSGDGTPVNERVYGDHHEFFAKLMRLAGQTYNGLPDNETNGYQLIDALKAYANKNAYVYDLATSGGKLTIATKLGILKDNETLLCKATVDKGAQTQLRGSDNVDKTITFVGTFKTGEYVQLVSTGATVVLVRLSNAVNLNLMISELLYLKAASTAQELAGLLNTVATTPLGNILAFAEWVNGTPSAASLASAIRNGLYPKEHFAIVENIGNDRIRNIGWFSGIDVKGDAVNTIYPKSGDINEARLVTKAGNADIYQVTMTNAMDNVNYYVRTFIQGQSGSLNTDNDLKQVLFKVVSTTIFQLILEEDAGINQNLKVHIEAVQIS